MPQNILIVGATGVIGVYITRAIVAAKAKFGRVAILTSPATLKKKADLAEKLKGQGVEILQGDIAKEEDVKKAYHGINTVVSCLGRTAILMQIPLLQWASETPSVTRFFPSEYGTDIAYNASSAHEKPHQLKLKVRAYIKELQEKSPGKLEYTYVVTGPYSDLFFGKMLLGREEAGGFDVQAKRAVLLGSGKEKFGFTGMADVGKLVVGALEHQDASKNATLIVNSFTATPDEILAEFEKQTGDSKWDVKYTSLEELKKAEEKAWSEGTPVATIYTLKRIWTEGGTLYSDNDNGKIGNPKMETLAEQVQQAVAAQSS